MQVSTRHITGIVLRIVPAEVADENFAHLTLDEAMRKISGISASSRIKPEVVNTLNGTANGAALETRVAIVLKGNDNDLQGSIDAARGIAGVVDSAVVLDFGHVQVPVRTNEATASVIAGYRRAFNPHHAV